MCARGGSRTHMSLRTKDFKSFVYAIPPPGLFIMFLNLSSYFHPVKFSEAMVGLAPTNNGFADRRVSYFTTWPTPIYSNIFFTSLSILAGLNLKYFKNTSNFLLK